MGSSCITGNSEQGRQIGRTDRYALVLLNARGTQVLLRMEDGGKALPIVCIPQFTRPAQQITSLIKDEWGITAVLLWSNRVESAREIEYFAVLEVVGDIGVAPAPLKWCDAEAAIARVGSVEAGIIEGTRIKALQPRLDADPEPFSRIGWMGRVQEWIRTLAPVDLYEFDQFNGSETFSLVKFITSTQPLWFKAVGKPNIREFSITLLLSRLFPGYVPKILGSDPLINGWVMKGAGDSTLRESNEIDEWSQAARLLAQLQVESISHTTELLKAGCHDRRFDVLKRLISPFFDVMAELMQRQTKTDPAPLTRHELSDLASDIAEALDNLDHFGIPVTLGHGDCGPGNIVIEHGGCVLIDWAEAYVGCPFFTLEYLVAHLKKARSSLVGQEHKLREAYVRTWAFAISHEQIAQAFSVAPLIAAYAYAACSPSWQDAERLSFPRLPAYFRSMTRTMKKEADRFRLERPICRV